MEMTPIKKAEEIVNKFKPNSMNPISCARKSVLLIISVLDKYDMPDLCKLTRGQAKEDLSYWREVLEEFYNL